MGALEQFVSRWSRLKRALDSKSDPRAAGATQTPAALNVGGNEASAKQHGAAGTFDITALPSLESISAGTDIRAFLQSAVPVELTRAALRRAWVSDPHIRVFIGIAENQWDFNNPTTIPGFGPLPQAANEAGRVARAVEALDRSLSQVATAHPTGATTVEAPTPASDSRRDAIEDGVGEGRSTLAVPTLDKEFSVSAPANSRSEETAMDNPSRENLGTGRPRRAHGGALPR